MNNQNEIDEDIFDDSFEEVGFLYNKEEADRMKDHVKTIKDQTKKIAELEEMIRILLSETTE